MNNLLIALHNLATLEEDKTILLSAAQRSFAKGAL